MVSKKPRPDEALSGDASDVRTLILNAALDLFYRQSYAATGVQQIVDAAGRTKGAFYHYWDSKERLLLEIHDTFHHYAIGRGRDILARKLPADEALHEIMLELLRQVDLYQKHMTVVFHETKYTPYDKYPESKKLRNEYEAIVKTVINDGVESGVFRRDLEGTNVMAFGVMGMCVWACNWFKAGGSLGADEIGEMYARVMVDGLRKR